MISGSISAPYIVPLRVEQTPQFLIDTNTLIEIRSDSSDVDIYYTLDGTKPDAFITLTTKRSTIQYRKPFYVPREFAHGGKVPIKAVAVSRNGIRESIVVTKIFDIKIVPSDHLTSDEYENRYLYELQQERKELMRRVHDDHDRNLPDSLYHSRNNLLSQENSPQYINVDSQKPPEVLQCAHCFAPKMTDAYTRFCTSCGRPWKKLTQILPENHSVNICANCKSTIPFNSEKCAVCETSGLSEPPQRPKVQNQTTIICPQCKSANPRHLRACYICESILIPTSTPQIRASVSVPILSDTMMTCSKCLRVNNIDARFCDWCGSYPEKPSIPVSCTKCRANNDPNAKFCSSCGCVMEAPVRVIDSRFRNDLSIPTSSVIANTLTRHSVNPMLLNANATLNNTRQPSFIIKNEAATQTYGIYYPSPKDVDTLITQNKQLQETQAFKERYPVLTSASPGKGYWKQQVDHVYAHLKAYATNRPEFRSLIGEPRMGKMVHATVEETEDQIIVRSVFRKPENLSQPSLHIDQTNQRYTMNNERSLPFSSGFNSDDEYTRDKSHRSKVRKRPQSTTVSDTDSPNHALIKLLEKKSTHHSDNKKSSRHINVLEEIKRLLKEKKADANGRNKDGYTAIQLAVRNGHVECLETLIKDGHAKLDKRGPRGTTALHESCLLGSDGIESLKILIQHGGDVTWMNDKKESVVDLAAKQNCPELLQVISSNRGQQMLNRQIKNYYDDDDARIKTTNGYRSSERS
ncbi:unnamed protein product [Adineta steineri]|uniref:Double zinc ribbon and ankyrin repeat-containing protein 1 n=1 Tax=Adineta steineri TaxID=433720 RepID=A0A815FV18_9BILA|nr:unnamed protein product [Adineta steineri]